jgi:S-adenosyl methyltransferase
MTHPQVRPGRSTGALERGRCRVVAHDVFNGGVAVRAAFAGDPRRKAYKVGSEGTQGPGRGPDEAGASGAERASFDTSVAHIARVYDYWLGGKDNFAADRAAAEQAIAAWPDIVLSVRASRAFLARVVRYLAGGAGIRQFLDIGTGIPASNNTHEVAQSVAPESRVVYVDNDPVVLAHARAHGGPNRSSRPGAQLACGAA